MQQQHIACIDIKTMLNMKNGTNEGEKERARSKEHRENERAC